MRYFETINGHVKDEAQIEEALFITHGKRICGKVGIDFHIKYCQGIKREILNPEEEYMNYIFTDKIGAIKLYRACHNYCSLVEAKNAIDILRDNLIMQEAKRKEDEK